MANIPGEIVWQANDNTWFTTNAAEVYPAGITIYHVDGRYKFTDGVTALSALSFLGGGSAVQSVTGPQVDNTDPFNPIVNTPTLQEVTDEGNVTTNFIAFADIYGNEPVAIGRDSIDVADSTFSTLLFCADRTTDKVTVLGEEVATKPYVDGMVAGLLDDRGSYDASSNLFPSTGGSGTAGAILKGDIWYISVAGTLGGQAVVVGDSVRALVDTPSQTSTNWSILETNIGYVPENVVNKSSSYTASSTTTYANTKALVDGLDSRLFTISFEAGVLSPADGVILYMSDVRIAPNNSPAAFAFNLGYAYKIVGAKIGVGNNSTAGTSEDVVGKITNITTATSHTVGNFKTNGLSNAIASTTITGLSIDVAASDEIAFRMEFPTYVTNPVGCIIFVTLICKTL